jgi:UPF0755 protein
MTILGLRLPVLLLFLVGFPLFWLAWIGAYAISPGPPTAKKQIEVVIPSRTGLENIQKILAENQVVKDDARFGMLAVLLGMAKQLQAGEYSIASGLHPYEVLRILRQGKVLYRPVTIPEGTELVKVADILADGGWVDRGRFLILAKDQIYREQIGVSANSLEGYLFPDTYYLSRGRQDEADIIKMMVGNHQQVFNDIMQGETQNSTGLTSHEIITLASIVEKETGQPLERPMIARVFLNRLARNMRLQADPTVRYATGKPAGPLTRQDLNIISPFNTYKIKGLPPGPICNPGRAAILAVVHPAAGEHLYFVSRNDSTHHFSKTLQEHNRAVNRYQKSKNGRDIKAQ